MANKKGRMKVSSGPYPAATAALNLLSWLELVAHPEADDTRVEQLCNFSIIHRRRTEIDGRAVVEDVEHIDHARQTSRLAETERFVEAQVEDGHGGEPVGRDRFHADRP